MKIHTASKAAVIALSVSLLGGAALAQDGDRDRDRDRHDDAQQQDQQDQNQHQRKRGKHRPDQQNQDQGQGQNQGQPQPQYQGPQSQGQNQDRGRFEGYGRRQDQGQNQQNQDDGNADNRRSRNWGDNDRRGDDHDRNDANRRGWGNNNLFDKGGREGRDRRWDRFRRDLTSPQRYRMSGYHPPRGYYYRRWHHGQRLPVAFYRRDYWLTDFFIFGLFAPPPDLVWVRYGPDALLIDRYTGEIVQVRYNVFYG